MLYAETFGETATRRTAKDGNDESFMKLGGTWFLLEKANAGLSITGDHVALMVSPSMLVPTAKRLAAMGHAYQLARTETASYFQDFDSHLF